MGELLKADKPEILQGCYRLRRAEMMRPSKQMQWPRESLPGFEELVSVRLEVEGREPHDWYGSLSPGWDPDRVWIEETGPSADSMEIEPAAKPGTGVNAPVSAA